MRKQKKQNTLMQSVKCKMHSLLMYARILGTLIVIVVVLPIFHLFLRYFDL